MKVAIFLMAAFLFVKMEGKSMKVMNTVDYLEANAQKNMKNHKIAAKKAA